MVINVNHSKSVSPSLVFEVENYVIEHGTFIGGMSKEGFFICENTSDVFLALWLSMINDWDVDEQKPNTLFLKKANEFYKKATILFTAT